MKSSLRIFLTLFAMALAVRTTSGACAPCTPFWMNVYCDAFGKTYVLMATSVYNYVGGAVFNYYTWDSSTKRYVVTETVTQSNAKVKNVWMGNGRFTPHGTNNEECYHTIDFGGITNPLRIGSFGYYPEIGSVSAYTIWWYLVVF